SGADVAGRARMFAPKPFQCGSSVSHYDSVASPNQLMEPSISADLTHNVAPPFDLTFPLLLDLGWTGTASSTNPIDTTSFFVRQHYLDFFSREPDAGGLSFWTGEIDNCTPKPQCTEVKRINVSAAFFLSIEFQETGYLVYRMYKSSFGNLPGAPVPVKFAPFLSDTQQIGQGVIVNVGNWQAQLEANKQAFALAFMQRPELTAVFPNGMSATAFVDQMNANAGGVLSATERQNLINSLSNPNDAGPRAQALRAIAEDQDLQNAEFNKAFVRMQYFGYLRRNPNDPPEPTLDFAGYNFWLNKLNQFNGNFTDAEMVKAFITSIEYRQRFGTP